MPYNQLEEPLNLIHKRFVSLDECEVNQTKKLVRKTLYKLVSYMKEEDAVFQELYTDLYFGGSFYHNLKIQNPDEFDIDFLLLLPTCYRCQIRNCACVKIAPSPVPGCLYFKMKKTFSERLSKKFCRNGYVQSNLIYNWMKSLIYKALNRFKNDKIYFETFLRDAEVNIYTECSPAVKICIKDKTRSVYVDLAAAFKLEGIYWPSLKHGYKANPTKQAHFSIVPFVAKGSQIYWRPSFQEQEKYIISGKDRLKPALRLIKIMKTNLNHKVSSYVLKTLILEISDKYEWKDMSLAQTFMILLQKYLDCLRDGIVQYYWNKNVNLLDYIKKETLLNHYNEVNKIYQKICRECDSNPLVVAEVILKKYSDINTFNRDWEDSMYRSNNVSNTKQNIVEYYFGDQKLRINLQNLMGILENFAAVGKIRKI